MSSVLRRKDVIEYLNELHTKFVVVPIDKAANNVAFICKRFYVEVILREIGILGTGNETYIRVNQDRAEIVNENVNFLNGLVLLFLRRTWMFLASIGLQKNTRTPLANDSILLRNIVQPN